jgi:hypothetical protein
VETLRRYFRPLVQLIYWTAPIGHPHLGPLIHNYFLGVVLFALSVHVAESASYPVFLRSSISVTVTGSSVPRGPLK